MDQKHFVDIIERREFMNSAPQWLVFVDEQLMRTFSTFTEARSWALDLIAANGW